MGCFGCASVGTTTAFVGPSDNAGRRAICYNPRGIRLSRPRAGSTGALVQRNREPISTKAVESN